MVMTETALMFLGAFALLATIGMFVNFDDDNYTNAVIGILASVLWGFFGLSSFDVQVVETYYATKSEPIMQFVILGLGLAGIVFLYSIYQLMEALSSDAESVSAGGFLE